ncbi:MAG: flagellar basal body P-ring formation chaperone FlgA [Gammaproteobacteria bacterium]
MILTKMSKRFSRRRCAVLSVPALAFAFCTANAAQWQSPQSVRNAAEQFVRTALAGRPDISVEARSVDDRLRLPACSQPLEAFAERPLRNGQGTVTVECSGASAWRLFVPVRATHNVDVVVTANSMSRGQRISEADVRLHQSSSATLPLNYVTQLEDVVGLTLTRSMPAGTVLVSGALDYPNLVTRGDLVTLIAGARGIMVKSAGTALEDAALTERVRVRTQMGRVVEGVVEALNVVRVGPQR